MKMMDGMGIMEEGEPKRTKYTGKPLSAAAMLTITTRSKYPSLDLSGQKLGEVFIAPYLIAGNWNIVDLTGCQGHVVFNGYANRLVLEKASGIYVRLIGAFGSVDVGNIGPNDEGRPSWIELNGDIFEIDLRGSSVRNVQLIHSIAEPGHTPSLKEGKAGKVTIKPFDIKYVVSDDSRGWRKAIAENRRGVQEGLNMFAKRKR